MNYQSKTPSNQQQNVNPKRMYYAALGLVFGAILGLVLGGAIGSPALGLIFGAGGGLTFGSALDRRRK